MGDLLSHITVETSSNPDATVIWLHGLGADGHDFEPIVPELNLPKDSAVRFIFPNAPSIPVTINGGYVMPAWYDILEMSIDRKVDDQQLRASANEIVKIINNEIALGIKSERIILAGFSQGGAVAIESALTFEKKLGGLLLMSTYFATKDTIEFSPQNRDIPVVIHHGDFDPVVPVTLSQVSEQKLKQENYQVSIRTYPMEHSVCSQQINDIGQWLAERLA
ncbi:MAG: dienelactone hydrolase family protein [Kangiellaceae bacterium]|nr:dienelactone hydrolase family protein [Kangiellaceae bacterium]